VRSKAESDREIFPIWKKVLSHSGLGGTRGVVMASSAHDSPVDLDALRVAAAPVVAWYAQLLAGRPMPVADLDVALVGIRALPPISGRLGKALALVATGGREATSDETVAAFELLRCSAGLRSKPATSQPGAATTGTRRRRKRDWTQPPLPGIEAT